MSGARTRRSSWRPGPRSAGSRPSISSRRPRPSRRSPSGWITDRAVLTWLVRALTLDGGLDGQRGPRLQRRRADGAVGQALRGGRGGLAGRRGEHVAADEQRGHHGGAEQDDGAADARLVEAGVELVRLVVAG